MKVKLLFTDQNIFVYSRVDFTEKQLQDVYWYFDESKTRYKVDTSEKNAVTFIIEVDIQSYNDVLYSLAVGYSKNNWVDVRSIWE